MKRTLGLFLILGFIMVIAAPISAQVLWRSAGTMKKGSIIAMGQWYYMNYTKSYDWTNEEWKDFPDDKKSTVWGFETMFGYAITDRWEAMLHVPIAFKSSETPNSLTGEIVKKDASGIGDIYLKTRYGIIPWSKSNHGLVLIGSLRLPTGDDETDIALGDGTTDLGLAGIFSTAWMNNFRGHLKLNYWLNGENSDTKVKSGNEMKLIVKLDRNLSPKVMPFLSYTLTTQGKTEVDGSAVDNTNKSRHIVTIGGVWKPKPGLFIRPKVALPLGGKGSSLYSFKPMLDAWYIFKI